jgi:hypothetical protein
MTGIGRFENTIFFLMMPTTLQLDEIESPISVGSGPALSRAIASISSPGLFPKPPARRITANGFGSDAIVPSRRWYPISRLGLPWYETK